MRTAPFKRSTGVTPSWSHISPLRSPEFAAKMRSISALSSRMSRSLMFYPFIGTAETTFAAFGRFEFQRFTKQHLIAAVPHSLHDLVAHVDQLAVFRRVVQHTNPFAAIISINLATDNKQTSLSNTGSVI